MQTAFRGSVTLIWAWAGLVCYQAQGQPTNRQQENQSNKISTARMETSQNKAAVRRLYEEYLNSGKLDQLDQIIAEECTGIRGEKGPIGFVETVAGIRAGFPDIKWTVEDLIEEGNKVVVRWSWQGTNSGSFRGFAASHKLVTDHAIAIYEFKNHKIVHAWIQSDRLGFLQQIGIVPADLGARPQLQKKE